MAINCRGVLDISDENYQKLYSFTKIRQKMIAFKIVVFITVLLTALITGFFYAYSCSVNGGLKRLPDQEYLRAMQSINKAVLNPLFFMSFFGTLVMLPLTIWMWYKTEGASGDFIFSPSLQHFIF